MQLCLERACRSSGLRLTQMIRNQSMLLCRGFWRQGTSAMEKVRDYLYQLQEKTELPVAPLHDPDAPRSQVR